MSADSRSSAGVGLVLLSVLLALLAAGLFAKTWLQVGNTLHAGGRWQSAKIGLSHGILGSVSFMTTRTALFRERLDLGVWHGHHELRWHELLDPERIELRFRLPGEGTFTVLLGDDHVGFDAVRFSRSPGLSGGCFRVAPGGRFEKRSALPVSSSGALDGEWHRFEWQGGQVSLDGESLGPCGQAGSASVRLGLRSTAGRKAWVDDLRIVARDGRAVEEHFANRRGAVAVGLVALLLVLGATGVVWLGTRAARQRGEVSGGAVLLLAELVLVAMAALLFATEWIYLGRLHPKQPDFADYENHIEYEGEIVPRLAREHPLVPPAPGVRRIVFLGSSQTWGSGAAAAEEPWVTRLERGWNETASPGTRVECINTGIPAFTGPQIVPLWTETWSAWAPELVVVDLGNNDRDFEALEQALETLAVFNRERGIHTVFVLEPNTIEARGEESLAGLLERHDILRKVGGRHGLPVLDLHAALVARRDEGFLWWDRVHLTSFGHQVMAEELARLLASLPPFSLDHTGRP
ncbi:MAG: SGNH/GDSL hydrolase family protein [bacterium]|nr:SGNH/GDSL hydrolase family protein [bacterium]